MTQSKTFKPGDKLVVLDASDRTPFRNGDIVTVARMDPFNINPVYLVGHGGYFGSQTMGWASERFALQTTAAPKVPTFRVQEVPGRSEFVVERRETRQEPRRRAIPSPLRPYDYYRYDYRLYDAPRYETYYETVESWVKVQAFPSRAAALTRASELSKPTPKTIATYFSDGSAIIA